MNCNISIIMPSLNVVDYIDKCIQSVLNQTLSGIEILCIDAGSTDGTLEKLVKYAECDSRIKVVNSDIKSYGYQVNMGIKMATGDYVAIVETDDYVKPNMYETLYCYATKYEPNYVKGSYEMVYTTHENTGSGADTEVCLDLNSESSSDVDVTPVKGMGAFDRFGQVIDPRDIDLLHVQDLHIWRGIYKRDFLIENNILLNESPGAAFQDIGFSKQVLTYAKTAIYVDEPLYCYRMDRDESSTYSLNCFKNTYVEFARIIEGDFSSKIVNKSGIYKHLALAFIWEINAVLKMTDFNLDSEYITPYCGWFVDKLRYALDKGLLIGGDILDSDIKKINLAVSDMNKYVETVQAENMRMEQQQCEMENYNNMVTANRIVIFGCGVRGKRILEYAKVRNSNIVAMTDNNSRLWNSSIEGIQVFSPDKCLELFSDAVWVVANAKHEDEIYNQIIDLGIARDRVLKAKL